jgi:FkbM family methyltransferase
MKVIQKLINRILFLIRLKIIRIPHKYDKISEFVKQYINKPDEFYLSENKENIILPELGNLEINPVKFEFVLKGYEFLKEIYQQRNVRIHIDSRLQFQIDDFNVYINSWEEIFILKEIFTEGIYNIHIPSFHKSVFIDIGMNVGFTTLFFAKFKKTDYIYAFEPFKDTYDLAQLNFALNQDVTYKIKANNYGLGNSNRQESWNYNLEYKGSMGINGSAEHIPLKPENYISTKVEIKDAANEINEIINLHKDSKIILKLDCEGAEYEILESLGEKNIIDKIDLILIEWHQKGPDEILKTLLKKEYKVISLNEKNKIIGMVYAIK